MSPRSKIHLSNKVEDCHSYWQEEITFTKLVPPLKVSSLFEVSGNIKLASLSSHYDYLVVVHVNDVTTLEIVHLIYLKEKRLETLKVYANPVTLINFIPDCEDALLIGSELKLFYININTKDINILDGHNNHPSKISYRRGSNFLISWNVSEVLLWSWPQQILSKRLNLEPGNVVVEAGHVWESQTIFAAFTSGIILLWNQNMKEFIIEPPTGISMEFRSFSLSSDGEWLIGAGSQEIIVIYCMTSRRVTQVTHLSPIDSSLGIQTIKFLPCIHPQYPKTFLIQTSKSIIIAHFINSSIVKVLNSHRYSITNVCISGDGFLLCVTYGNGTSKLYTLLSFFPPPLHKLERTNVKSKEVKFSIMKVNEEEQNRNDVSSLFDETKWKEILEEFEEFPKSYRKHIWVSLMKLPRNYSILNDLLIKEKTFKYDNLAEEFPETDSSELDALKSVLECLCCWSPFLSQVEFLPSFVLPFLRLFDYNILLCFEASIFIIFNWFRFWFEKPSSSTRTFASLVEDSLRKNDREIMNHLDKLNISTTKIVHLLLSSAFRQVLTFEEWMILWDHIISKPQKFMISLCACFISCLRQPILKCSKKCHILKLFCQETWISIRSVIKRTKSFHTSFSNLSKTAQDMLTEKMYLTKGNLVPYDSFSWNEDILKLAHLQLDTSRRDEQKLEDITQANEVSCSRGKNIAKFKEIGQEQLRTKENSCIKHIQETRKRLINKI